jgi:site-specific DNA recombinase
MRVVDYARFSSDNQRESSIADQVRNCERRAKHEGWSIARHYEDKAISGSTTERPGYQVLMKAARAREFDVLLIDDMSRLSRDSVETELARRRLVQWGIRLIGVSDGIDTASKGHKALSQFKGVMNEVFLDDLRDKTHRGLSGKAIAGFHCGGKTYGYKSVPIYHASKTDPYGRPVIDAVRLEVDPDQAALVRGVYEQYADGHSARRIASQLNEQRIPSPRGSTWCQSTIYVLLNNPLYQGQYQWNRREWFKDTDTHRRVYHRRPQDQVIEKDMPELRIIPPTLWERVEQRRRESITRGLPVRHALAVKGRPAGGQFKFLFSGLLKCGQCQANFVIVAPDVYGCASVVNRGKAVCTNSLRVRRDVVESRLLRGIKRDLFSDEGIALFIKETTKLLTEQNKALGADRERAEKRQSEIEQHIAHVMMAIKAGIITASTKAELEKLEAEKATVAQELREENAGRNTLAVMLPRAVERFKRLVGQLEHVTAGHVVAVRPHLRALLGGHVTLYPHADGYLNAEMTGEYSGLIKMCGFAGKLGVVAGEGFEPSTFGL